MRRLQAASQSALVVSRGAALMAEQRPLFREIKLCPLCGGDRLKVIREEVNALPSDSYFDAYRDVPPRLALCLECRFAFVRELPAEDAYYRKLYLHSSGNWDHEFLYHGKRLNFEQARRALLRHGHGGRLLDVGAWTGNFIHHVSDVFQAEGIEVDPHAAETGRRMGLKMACGSFQETKFDPASFDAITFIDVLEHLPHPGEILEKARVLLRREGLLFIKVPNYRAQMRKQDLLQKLHLSNQGIMQNFVHINHFSPKTLKTHLERKGFTVLEWGYTMPEIWNPSLPAPIPLQLKRAGINAARIAATALINGMANVLHFEGGFNFYVLARLSA